MIDKKISPQEHKFVLAYLETGKAGLSAKLAGYSEKSCDSQANRNSNETYVRHGWLE